MPTDWMDLLRATNAAKGRKQETATPPSPPAPVAVAPDSPAALLASLRQRGFTLSYERPEADHWLLHVIPTNKLTTADRQAIREHKDALLDLLWHEQPSVYDNLPAVPWTDPTAWRQDYRHPDYRGPHDDDDTDDSGSEYYAEPGTGD